MNILDTIYHVAYSYPGGVPALAARMGKNPVVMNSKLNTNINTHHVNVEEAAMIADFADSDEIAKAFAGQRNMVCIPLVEHEGISDMELLDLFLKQEKEKGEWSAEIQTALADGAVDQKEMKRIQKEFMEFCTAGAELMSRLESMVPDKPVPAFLQKRNK